MPSRARKPKANAAVKLRAFCKKNGIDLNDRQRTSAEHASIQAALRTLNRVGATPQNHPEFYTLAVHSGARALALETVFRALLGHGITINQFPRMFEHASYHFNNPSVIVTTLASLKAIGASPSTNPALYEYALRHADTVKQFADSFNTLSVYGTAPSDHEQLFLTAITEARQHTQLPKLFETLKRYGITPQSHATLCDTAIENSFYSARFPAMLDALHTVGANPNRHADTYNALLQQAPRSHYALQGIQVLQALGVDFINYEYTYYNLIIDIQLWPDVHHAIKALQKLGGTWQAHTALFSEIIFAAEYASQVPSVLSLLKQNGININDHSEFAYTCFENIAHSAIFQELFNTLRRCRASIAKHAPLFEVAFENCMNGHAIITLFKALHHHGANPTDHLDLYILCAKHACMHQALLRQFNAFKACGLSPTHHHSLYTSLLGYTTSDEASTIDATLELLMDMNLLSPKTQWLLNCVFKNPTHMLHLLSSLEEAGFSVPRDSSIYLKLLEQLQLSLEVTTRLLNACCAYARSHQWPSITARTHPQHLQALNAQIDDILHPRYSYGPLNKSTATHQLERLLKNITSRPLKETSLHYTPASGYVLTHSNKRGPSTTVHLNLLLNEANLSHLTLSNDLIRKIGDVMVSLKHSELTYDYSPNSFVKLLPIVSQQALSYYTGEAHKNINRLMRGELLDKDADYHWLTPTMGRNNLLLHFLLGILVNDAANKLTSLPWQTKTARLLTHYLAEHPKLDTSKPDVIEAAYNQAIDQAYRLHSISSIERAKLRRASELLQTLYPAESMLVRGEEVSDELCSRRINNPQKLPAATSFSSHKNIANGFYSESSTQTTFQGPSRFPVISSDAFGVEDENEVVIPSGETLIYSKNEHGFFINLVRSPELNQHENYMTSLALETAYNQHLKKQYRDSHETTVVEGTTIPRANHGLANAYRVVQNIDIVINYFAHFALDDDFKYYCQFIAGSRTAEHLKVAAAFRVSGRESEISALDDLKRYNEFKVASANNLARFIAAHETSLFNSEDDRSYKKAVQERLLHIVTHLGNPAYEKPHNGKPAVNTHPDLQERALRNYQCRLLRMAHDLDLSRCYTPDQYDSCLAGYRELSRKSLEQKAALTNMIAYNMNLILSHGDSLYTGINQDGSLIAMCKEYESPFDEVSTSLKRLHDASDTVTRPKLTQSYQFPVLPGHIHKKFSPTPRVQKRHATTTPEEAQEIEATAVSITTYHNPHTAKKSKAWSPFSLFRFLSATTKPKATTIVTHGRSMGAKY